jgi:hypothetical protein
VPFPPALDLAHHTGAHVLAGMPLEPVVLGEIARLRGVDPARDLALDTLFLGGSSLPPALQRRLARAWGARVIELYGRSQDIENVLEVPPEGSCPDNNPCTKEACSAGGDCTNVPDDTLIPDDGNECTTDACKDAKDQHTAKPDATTCGLNGGLECTAGSASEGGGRGATRTPYRCGRAAAALDSSVALRRRAARPPAGGSSRRGGRGGDPTPALRAALGGMPVEIETTARGELSTSSAGRSPASSRWC